MPSSFLFWIPTRGVCHRWQGWAAPLILPWDAVTAFAVFVGCMPFPITWICVVISSDCLCHCIWKSQHVRVWCCIALKMWATFHFEYNLDRLVWVGEVCMGHIFWEYQGFCFSGIWVFWVHGCPSGWAFLSFLLKLRENQDHDLLNHPRKMRWASKL